MDKGQLWKKFMQTGKVSDYLDYKNAKSEEQYPFEDDAEISEELAQEYVRNFGEEISDYDEEFYDVDQNGRYSDS